MNDSERERISDEVADLRGKRDPLDGVGGLRGIFVHHVGQGDAISVRDGGDDTVLYVDYGGHQKSPFGGLKADEARRKVDESLPIGPHGHVMLTHWDWDHWCSATKGDAVKHARWLVPRQVTSPSAVNFATALKDKIRCIPEAQVAQPRFFRAANGDEIWWEKIARSQVDASKYEDCNKTGVALAVVRHASREVILLPGDAPFGSVSLYRQLREKALSLTGIVAFHHGADTHWTEETRALLRGWPRTGPSTTVIFSCGKGNSYKHPTEQNYEDLFGHEFDGRLTHEADDGRGIRLDFRAWVP